MILKTCLYGENVKKEVNSMNKAYRILAVALVCLLAAVMLFSAFYPAVESDHECSGEDCAICAVLNACENFLHQLLDIRFAIAVAALIVGASILLPGPYIDNGCSFTLITHKVKLSN